MREAEDVVDEEQDVLALVAEIFRHREAREADARARAGRLVHLAVDQRAFRARGRAVVLLRIFVHARFDHLVIEVVAFARALADAGKHRIAAMRLRDIIDEFHNNDCLADAGTAKEADLAAARVGREQIDDLDAGNENCGLRRLFRIGRCVLVDGTRRLMRNRARLIHRLADHVHDTPERPVPDRHRDRLAGVGDFLSAHQAFGGVHRHRAHGRFAKMLRHFEHEPLTVIFRLQRVQDFRQIAAVELHVDDGADHLGDASDLVRCGSCHACPLRKLRG